MQRDTYYAGKQQEYWVKDKHTNKYSRSSSGPTVINNQAIPDKQCPHCGETCLILTSRTVANPGRMFFKCPKQPGKGFVQWCDEASFDQGQKMSPSAKLNPSRTDEQENSMQSPYPECACGAGICKLETAPSEKYKGKKVFICPVKRGHGACNFYQWQDSPETEGSLNEDGDASVNLDDISGTVSLGSKETLSSKVDDLLVPRVEDIFLSDKKTSVTAKPGKCYKCNLEGHWSRDCLKPSKSPLKSPCYKCGEIGHWAKDCLSKAAY